MTRSQSKTLACVPFSLTLGISVLFAGCGDRDDPRYPSASRYVKGEYHVELLFEPRSDTLTYGFVAHRSNELTKTNEVHPDVPAKGILCCTRLRDGLWIDGQRVPRDELTGFFQISAAGTRTPIDLTPAEVKELSDLRTDIDDTKVWNEKVLPALKQSEMSK